MKDKVPKLKLYQFGIMAAISQRNWVTSLENKSLNEF